VETEFDKFIIKRLRPQAAPAPAAPATAGAASTKPLPQPVGESVAKPDAS
jgi:hypothetical protein